MKDGNNSDFQKLLRYDRNSGQTLNRNDKNNKEMVIICKK